MSSMDECWTAMALTLKYKHRIILLATEKLMWTRCTSSSEKKKKLEVFETRINHFKSCKTSLFLLFPLLLRLICEAERQSFGELQKSHPNTSLAYFWQILSKLFPLFSLPTDHSKRSFWEERENNASFVIMWSFCNIWHHCYHEILIIIKIFLKYWS